VQGESISTPRATRLGYIRSMQHIITSSTAAPVRMRVEQDRRARDQSSNSGDDSLNSFKGISVGVLLSVALWVFLLGLYFLI
jgi:hypothetical protein